MLLAVRNFIQTYGVVSSEQLSREFQIPAEALDPMLEIWIAKGVVQKLASKHCGSSCQTCRPRSIAYYEAISIRLKQNHQPQSAKPLSPVR